MKAYRREQDKRSNINKSPPLPDYVTSGGGCGMANMAPGTSIFDPVLCEIIYKWFCPEQGKILDPFAGGSVRGIVAGYLGYDYTGIDLSETQIEANRKQADDILKGTIYTKYAEITNPDELTSIEKRGKYSFKRDDLFGFADVNGGKVRTCLHLSKGAKGLVTAGSRFSPQVNIVAKIAAHLDIPCHIHTPEGALSEEVQDAVASGAKLFQHRAGYNNVIIKRAKDDAQKEGYTNIPFGMECKEAIYQTKQQVKNISAEHKRIVVPVGSAMTLAGILTGLKEQNINIPVLAIRVGAKPDSILDKFAPENWRQMCQLVKSDYAYHEYYPDPCFEGIKLDPIYEAKCIPFLQEGDLLWIVGIRKTAKENIQRKPTWHIGNSLDIDNICKGIKADLIFSCPPYFDLEKYSDSPDDLSNLKWDEFLSQYNQIIDKSLALLKEDRFACFVVGDIRDKKGIYRNFVNGTTKAFIKNEGVYFYNDIVLINVAGSLPLRVGKQFSSYRKVGKMHQNILVFYKGDIKKIKDNFKEIEVATIE